MFPQMVVILCIAHQRKFNALYYHKIIQSSKCGIITRGSRGNKTYLRQNTHVVEKHVNQQQKTIFSTTCTSLLHSHIKLNISKQQKTSKVLAVLASIYISNMKAGPEQGSLLFKNSPHVVMISR